MLKATDYASSKVRLVRTTRHGALFSETQPIGYVEGRQFRTFYDFSLTTGQEVTFKLSSPVNFEILDARIAILSGEIEIKVYSGGTPSGTFGTPAPILGQNQSAERPTPYYTNQITINSGGTHTGGTLLEVMRVLVSNAVGQAASVGGSGNKKWFFPAGDYYIHIKAVSASRGVYDLGWEERLVSVP